MSCGNAGLMNRRITFQSVDDTTETLSDVATVWASLKPISGQRAIVYEQLQMGVWYDIKTNYRSDFTVVAGDPITYGSETLTVHQIIDENEAHEIWLIKAFVKRG